MIVPRLKLTALGVALALGQGEVMAAAGWDCQRGADGKEWVCVSGKGKPAKRPEEPRMEKPREVESKTGVEAGKAEPEREKARPRPAVEPAQPTETAEPEPIREPVPPIAPSKPVAPMREAEPEVRPATSPAASSVAEEKAPLRVEERKMAPAEPPPAAKTPGKAASQVAQKSGWNCRPGAGKEWDCSLAGADPRGEAHVVGEVGKATPDWAQSSDMTREDEQRFSSILAHMPANPWSLSCGRNKYEWTPSADFMLTEADRVLREKSPLQIQADHAELLHGESSNFQGSAELVRADQKLYGDFVTHNKESGALNAQGNVVYREKGLSFSSDTAFMKMGTDEGVLRNSQFILETVPARGTARVTHIDSKTKSRYETVTYTTCPPGDQSWLIHGTHATIDKETGRGTARNAWVEFKGVPFLWTPYMSFPVDDRRKSGFLAPHVGYSRINGFDFTLPYYFNLAPNYDLTLLPRYMSDRGGLLRADFRYLTTTSSGRMFADILPWDQIKDKTRGQVAWRDNSRFSDHWSSTVDVHLISDERYLFELGTLLSINSATNLRSWGSLNYAGGNLFGGNYSASLMADYYQLLVPSLTREGDPYRRLPQLNFNYAREVAGTGLQFQTNAELTRFDQPVKVTGERLNLRPRLYYPFQTPGGFITPSLSLQHTEYWLHNLGVGESSTFSRTAPIFSVDSGAYFERDFKLFDTSMQQTLEPRLFYLFVPKVSQPYNYNCVLGLACQGLNFDSAEYDFTFYQLFRENRFAGSDRVTDANQVTPALITRFISQDSGLERLKLSAGKIFYLRDPQVVMVPNGPQPTVKDNVVGEISSMLSEHWSFRSTGQWNPSENRLDRGQIALQYNNYANNLINLSYRYRRDPYSGSFPPLPEDPNYPRTVNQTDISARLPIMGGWYAMGRWQYDLASQVTVQTMLGVERETCCWRFSLIGLRYVNGALGPLVNPDNISTNNAVFFQFELKGLSRLGDQVDNFLMQNFSGFRREYETPGMYP